MNKFNLIAVLLGLAACSLAQADSKVEPHDSGLASVSVSSKGLDVRFVLHDLFTQAKKNYVLENVGRHDLYLNLTSVEFDESLALICKLCDLTYEVQNGIYTLRKGKGNAGKAATSVAPSKPVPSKPSASTKPASAVASGSATGLSKPETTSGTVSTVSTPDSEKPNAGKLLVSVLRKPVTGTFVKQDLRSIAEALGKSAGVKVEVDTKVPKYKLDFALGQTSLGWALNALAERLKLQVVFTEKQTILLRPVP